MFSYGESAETGSKSAASCGSDFSNHSGSPANKKKYETVSKQYPGSSYLEDCKKYQFHVAADKLYCFGPGYNFVIPSADSSVCNPPDGTTTVYLKHLEFGLRFPLNPEVKNILKAMNVALCQLHPICIRKIVGFVWTCKFLGFTPSVNVFRWLHRLTFDSKLGFWSIRTTDNYMTSYPKLESVKNWKERFLFLKVPLDWELPTHFRDSVRERLEPPNEWIKGECAPISSVTLTQTEQLTVEYFKKAPKEEKPLNWLPHVQVISQDEYLSRVGMIPGMSAGML